MDNLFHQIRVTETEDAMLQDFNLARYSFDGLDVIVCLECRVICLPNRAPGHLVGHGFKKAAILKALNTILRTKVWASQQQLEELFERLVDIEKRHRPIHPLEVHQGWQCSYCGRCLSTRRSLSTHKCACPKRPTNKIGFDSTPEPVWCQKLVNGKGKAYFRVYPEDGSPKAPEPNQNDLATLIELQQQKLDVTVDIEAGTKTMPWLVRTGWVNFCDGDLGYVSGILRPLASPNRGLDSSSIAAATRILLTSSLRYINQTSTYYRRLLNPPGNQIDRAPFGRQTKVTQYHYFKTFVRMVVYICSATQHKSVIAKSGMNLDGFRNDIDDIFASIGNSTQLQQLILKLIIKLLTTKLPMNTDSRFQHPIINFLAVDAYERNSHSWKSAKRSTPTFAAMSFCTRLCVLADTWKATCSSLQVNQSQSGDSGNKSGYFLGAFSGQGGEEEEHDQRASPAPSDDQGSEFDGSDDEYDYDLDDEETEEDEEGDTDSMVGSEQGQSFGGQEGQQFEEQFDLHFRQLLVVTKDNQNYPMGEWLSQHAYGKAISDNGFYSGHIFWSEDGSAILYHGERFCLHKYRNFIAGIASSIRGLLQDMMFTDKLVEVLELSNIKDDPSTCNMGYSFVTDPRNSRLYQPTLLLERIQADFRNIYYRSGSLCRTPMMTYLEKDYQLRLWLALAVLLTSGGPPRGTELMQLQKYNTTQRRSFMIVGGQLMILSTYSKSQGITGLMNSVCRFLPPDIGQLFVLYMFQVEPLVELFQQRLGLARSSLLFSTDGKPWETMVVSKFLENQSVPVLGFPLRISSYRQIIAAIVRRYVQDMAAIVDEMGNRSSSIVKQFNHTHRVHNSHYGVSASRVPDAEEIAVDQFLRASKNLQFFIGAIPQLPQWMVKPSIVSWSGRGVSDESGCHPLFRHSAFPAEVTLDTANYKPGPFPRELHQELRNQFGEGASWLAPEQAKLAQAILQADSPVPVLGVLPYGKTTAALLAVAISRRSFIFIVPSPSAANYVCKLAEGMGIASSVWDGHIAKRMVVITPDVAVSDAFLHQAYIHRFDVVVIDDAYFFFQEVELAAGRISKLGVPVVCITTVAPPAIVPVFQTYLAAGPFKIIRKADPLKDVIYSVHLCENLLAGVNRLRLSLGSELRSVVFCQSEAQAEDVAESIGGFYLTGSMDFRAQDNIIGCWVARGGVLVSTIPVLEYVYVPIHQVIHLGLPWSMVDWVKQGRRAEFNTVICRTPPNETGVSDEEPLWRVRSRTALNDAVTTTECRRAIVNRFMDGIDGGDCVMIGAKLCDNCSKAPISPFQAQIKDQDTRILEYVEEAGRAGYQRSTVRVEPAPERLHAVPFTRRRWRTILLGGGCWLNWSRSGESGYVDAKGVILMRGDYFRL
ncbi:hypothetical protein TWF730_006206 [Orbilia blumenaviensis]|uniref:RNA helicase n=1 Tax=Orbilia blumenaviensis TaxID=1796055 RepID=A0AAV9VH55_9PEZI